MFNIDFYNLINSIIVTIVFIYMYIPFTWMCIYEYRYYKGAGEDYLYYGKDYVKEKNKRFLQEIKVIKNSIKYY